MRNASLYEITNEYLAAFDLIEVDEETGEITGEEELEKLSAEFDVKAEAVALYIKNTEAMAEAIKAEEKILSERRKRYEAKVDSLKKYLSRSMTAAGKDKLETARAAISFRKSVAVEITDESLIPLNYMTEKVTVAPDKTALKKALQEGEIIEGVVLAERRNIQIK